VGGTSPDVWGREAGLAGYIDELNRRFGRMDGTFCGIIACGEGGRAVRSYTNCEASIPSPERSAQGVKKGAAENYQGRT